MTEQMRSGDWLYIIKPDGQKRIANPEYVRELLQIPNDRMSLLQEIRGLEARVEKLEEPAKAEKLKAFLKENGPSSTMLLRSRLGFYHYLILDGLVKSGEVVEVKAPKKAVRYALRGVQEAA